MSVYEAFEKIKKIGSDAYKENSIFNTYIEKITERTLVRER